MISIKFNQEQAKELEAVLEGLGKKLKKEYNIVINKTLKRGKAAIAKLIGQNTKLKSTSAKKLIMTKKSKELSGFLRIGNKRIDWHDFKWKKLKKGVKAQFIKGMPQLFPHAFGIPQPSFMPFQRRGKKRLPLDIVPTPSIEDLYQDTGIDFQVKSEINKILEGEMSRRIDKAIKKANRII